VDLKNRLSRKRNEKDVGKTFVVLIEGECKKSERDWMGRTSQNKVIVFSKNGAGCNKGDYVKVKVTDCTKATLLGEIA
jgi:tRNA-2-methylthio-N6-dimethylallyladenosine synthase